MTKLLVLAPHDLTLDPRIKWMSESLAKYFDVRAVGINQNSREPSFHEKIGIIQLDDKPNYWVGLRSFVLILSPYLTVFIAFCLILLSPLIFALMFLKMTQISKREFFKKNRYLSDFYFLAYTLKHFFKVFSLFVEFFQSTHLDDVRYVVANDLDSLLPAIYLRKKFNSEIVYDAHEFYPFQFPQATALLTVPLALIEASLLRFVKSVITVSPQLATVMKDYYSMAVNIYAIPNSSPIEERRIIERKKDERTIFLFQGVFAPGRGIETLIDFWTKIDPKHAILILRGPKNEFRSKCELLVSRAGNLNSSIHFDEPVSEEELIMAATQADVGIIPYEPTSINNLNCCPNKLSQYLQAGIAILSNDLPFVSSILTQSGAGLIYKSNDFNSFSKAVNEMISNAKLLNNMKESAYKFAKEEFNWEQVSAPVLNKIFGTP